MRPIILLYVDSNLIVNRDSVVIPVIPKVEVSCSILWYIARRISTFSLII